MSLLSVKNLHAKIEGQQVVEDVSFQVPANGVTAVLGRNGVGKSSTLKALLGLIERTGEVSFDGKRIDGLPTHRIIRQGIGYVPEDREIFSSLSVAENLRLAERDSKPNREMVEELFPDIYSRLSQRAGTLSGGQQQMVSLARALLNNNRILLVDEPTKGLAPKIVTQVTEVLKKAAETVPILLVEQNLKVVRQLAGPCIVLEGGQVVHTGSSNELLESEELTMKFLGVHSGGKETGVS